MILLSSLEICEEKTKQIINKQATTCSIKCGAKQICWDFL